MTTEEFLKLATRKGTLIRWHPSGVVERLYRTKTGKIFCQNLLTHVYHRIYIGKRETWHCTPVPLDGFVALGDLLPPSRRNVHA